MASKDFQGNDSPGTGAEDDRWLIAQVLNQAPDIVDVSLESMSVILRSVDLAPGKAASIVEDKGGVRRKMFRHRSNNMSCPDTSGHHEHHWSAAVGRIVETSAGNFEDTRLDLALRIGLCLRSAPGGQRQNGHCCKPPAE